MSRGMSNQSAPGLARTYTIREVATLINFHTESVRRAIRQGRIKALPFGRCLRIPGEEVERILSEGLPACSR